MIDWESVAKTLGIAGSLASLIGIPLALLSIQQAKRAARRSAEEAELSKNASIQAEQEVRRFRNDLKLLASIADFEHAVRMMDDLKSFVRNSTYHPLPDKISTLILLLNKIRAPSSVIDENDQTCIQECVVQLRKIEAAIDRANRSSDPPKGVTLFNQRISQQIDRLYPILADLKDRLGVRNDGHQNA